MVVDPSGKFLIAPDFCAADVDVYSIGADGALTAVAGSPFAVTSGNAPESAWIDPTGKFVYVTEGTGGPGTISAFSISAAGALTEITGSPFASGGDSFTVDGTPDGKFLYVSDKTNGKIVAFTINATSGALTPLSTPSFDSGTCWFSVATGGKLLFATDCVGDVGTFVLNADGTLTAAAGSPTLTGADGVYPVIGDPSGKFVYIGEDTNPGRIFAYQYTSAGALSAVPGSPFAATGSFIEGLYITH
jgi:6-phosphogluconolactonase (cycloisomerase 2 family)